MIKRFIDVLFMPIAATLAITSGVLSLIDFIILILLKKVGYKPGVQGLLQGKSDLYKYMKEEM